MHGPVAPSTTDPLASGPFEVWPGVPYPLGASFDGKGVNFAVASIHAQAMWVCLYDEADPSREIARLPLADQTNHVFHGYVPGLAPGALYNLRADGPWVPERGLRFNVNKCLVDPCAKALSGELDWSQPLLGHVTVDGREQRDGRDSAQGVPRCVVVHDDFDWSGERKPGVIWRRAVLYEAHVRGLTMLHPEVPEHQRGTYAGLAHPAVIKHLLDLGVTSVQLLPVHECAPEGFLAARGLTNYWGYNTLGYFAPEQRYSSSGSRGGQVHEFKAMVKALHQAGLEVILDVVYNHTCEGNELGPTVCWRGLDNPTYYWLDPSDLSRCRDFTGCGNSLQASHPQVTKLVLDSLRHWVTEYHVDGFRFDLATTLGRGHTGEFDVRSTFFAALHQDPVLSRVKLIMEPWDVGPGGYRLGNFPSDFAEWNDRYRQTTRRFWRGDFGQVADLGFRLTGSSDFFKLSGRRPSASINYVACHDGFTLRDLVSYSHKHNHLNLEDNRDGADGNDSTNCGAEGEVDDPAVLALRERLMRDFMATLFLSVGTPMLLAGDEFGRTQWGNNNAYCQDNELSWVHWNLDARGQRLLDFTRRCIALRNAQPVLQRRHFFLGSTLEDSRFRDLVWFHEGGRELERRDWEDAGRRALGVFMAGDAIATRDPTGHKLVGDTLLLYLNAAPATLVVTLPPREWGERWQLVLDTAESAPRTFELVAGQSFELPAQAMLVFRQANG
jgi:glycogen operon protein